jgi:hypothetical protein
MMKSIKHIFENSNFYKELRIVSLLDRLLEAILGKIKGCISMSLALKHGKSEQLDFFSDENTQIAVGLVKKYKEHFFIEELLEEKKEDSYISNSTNESSSESSSTPQKEETKGQNLYRCKSDLCFRGGA